MLILSFLKRNWFILGIFAAVIFGYNFSAFVRIINRDGAFFTFIVIFLFFIQGLILEKEKLLSGIKNIKLHIILLFFTFIFCPLYFFVFVKILPFINNAGVIAGLFALACIPTTIGTNTIFVSMADGNVSGSIFNSVISNMTGVFITPLLFSFMLKTTVSTIPLSMLSDIFINLAIRIIIPMGIGMILRNFAISFIDKNKKKFSITCSISILFIVLIAIAGSSNTITLDLVIKLYPIFIFLALSYWTIALIAYGITNLVGFSHEDKITSVFTSAQKTLAMGVPLITLYFKDNQEMLGIILIPLLFYHPWQIFSSSFMVRILLRKKR